jgi:hypothetical protein
MEEIINEYLSTIVQEDIDTYISLHKDVTPDLLEHVEIMTNELWTNYETDILSKNCDII